MAYISTFIYAEESRNEVHPQGQKMNVVNPMLLFSPKYIPGQFSFAVAIGILELDYRQAHKFRYLLKGPDLTKEPLVDTGDAVIPSQENPRNLPLEMQGIYMGFDLRNVEFTCEGKYTSEVLLDGVSLGTYPIFAKGMNLDAQKPTAELSITK